MTVDLQISVGTRVGGDFRIVRPLNAGGMGAVYVAEQETTGKPRALKLMHRELVADAKLRERFEQEARVGSMIPSDHIVQVIGAGVDQATGMPWLAMELLEGEDLASCVSARGPIPADEVLGLFEQICHGLGAAHAAGVVHRDMKPENIFLAKTRTTSSPVSVKLLDFGIARVAAEAKTAATAAIGTPLWMAPEQSDPRAPITPSADVWSLGLIAFTMLTGRTFWRTASDPLAAMTAVMREILFEPIAAASHRAGELGYRGPLPEGFDAWFARCVVREPKARFVDASEAMRALKPALTSAPIEIRGSGGGVGVIAADSSMETQAFLDLAYAPTNVAPLSSAPTVAAPPSGESPAAPGSATDGAVAITASRAATNPEASLMGPSSAEGSVNGKRPRGRRPAMVIAGALLGAGITTGLFAYLARKPPPPPPPPPSAAEEVAPPSGTVKDSPAIALVKPPLPPEPPQPPPSEPASPTASASAAASAAQHKPTAASASPTSAASPKVLAAFDSVAAQKSVGDLIRAAQFACAPQEGPRAIPTTVYFDPTGGARRVDLDFSVINTGTGMCVRSYLYGARVPPFRGNVQQAVGAVALVNQPFRGKAP